jgi:hypothetical protein
MLCCRLVINRRESASTALPIDFAVRFCVVFCDSNVTHEHVTEYSVVHFRHHKKLQL